MSNPFTLTLDDFERMNGGIGDCPRPLFEPKRLPLRVLKMVELSVRRSEGKGKDIHVAICPICGSWVLKSATVCKDPDLAMVTAEWLQPPPIAHNGPWIECRGCRDLHSSSSHAYEFARDAWKWQTLYLEEWLHERIAEIEGRQALHAHLLEAAIKDLAVQEMRIKQNETAISKAADALEAITKKIVEQLPGLAEQVGALAEMVHRRFGIKVGKS